MVGHGHNQDGQPLRSEVLSEVSRHGHSSLRGLESEGRQGGVREDVGHLESYVSQTSSCWRAGWTRSSFNIWNVDKFVVTRRLLLTAGDWCRCNDRRRADQLCCQVPHSHSRPRLWLGLESHQLLHWQLGISLILSRQTQQTVTQRVQGVEASERWRRHDLTFGPGVLS